MDIKPENFHCVITPSSVTTVTHHPAVCAQSEQLPDIVCVCVCQAQLHAVFSSFGPVYLLKVSPNAPLHPPGFYALIKFFSAAHAAAAQRITDGRPLLDDSPLKVTTFSSSLMNFVCFPGAHLAVFVGFR